MEISVVVPFCNEEKYIERCVKSLMTQNIEKRKYEVIFIDNGSSDRSAEIIQNYPVILLSENKQGAYAARNRGLSIAKGRIIAFTDADCEVASDWLLMIYNLMKDRDSVIILGKRIFPDNKSSIMKAFEDYENSKIEYIFNRRKKTCIFGFTNNMAVSADIFKKSGNFKDIERGADTEFITRCVSGNPFIKAIYSPDTKVKHLEIETTRGWLKKLNIYGERNLSIERKDTFEILNTRTKLEILNYCIKKNKYTSLQAIMLLICLIIGQVAYSAGRAKGNAKRLFSRTNE